MDGLQSLLLLLLLMTQSEANGNYRSVTREERNQNNNNNTNGAKSSNENALGVKVHAAFHNMVLLLTILFIISLVGILFLYNRKFKQTNAINNNPWVTRKNGKAAAPSVASRFK